MNAKFKQALLVSLTASVLAGCVVAPVPVSIGSKPADVAPQLVKTNDGKSVTWDRPGAFGPVPAGLADSGATVCATFNTKDTQFKAIGYHPFAKDENGNVLIDGGYFCVPK